jgi:hypothetical protein
MIMMPERDIVIFLGAGFSYDAGLPVMSNFGTKSRKDYEGLKKHLPGKGDERDAAEMLIEAADYFYAFQDYCLRSPTVTWEDVDNMETVFCIAEAMRETNMPKIPLKGKAKPCTPKELIRHISLWLWKIYQQCPICNSKIKMNRDRENVYKKFFDLLDDRICKRTSFITTNYDLIFEYMAYKNKKRCSYPGNITTFEIGHGDNFVCMNDDPGAKFVLCKLHGSVNFFEDSDNELFVSIDLAGKKPILKSSIKEDMAAIFAVDAIEKVHREYPSRTPAIIPPTYAKFVGKKWLREVWKHALNKLSTANTIIFIGYSMPPTDGFMRALIHTAFATRKRRNRPKVFVIDPNPQVHQNYQVLFGASYQNIDRYPLYWALKAGKLKQILRNAK